MLNYQSALALLLPLLILSRCDCQKFNLVCSRINGIVDVNYGTFSHHSSRNKDVISISMRDRFREGVLSLHAMFSVLETSELNSVVVTFSAEEKLISAFSNGVKVGSSEWNRRLSMKDTAFQMEAIIQRDDVFTAALLYPVYNRNNMSLQFLSVHFDVSPDSTKNINSTLHASTNSTSSVCRSISNYYGRKRATTIASESKQLFSKSFNVLLSIVNIALLLALRNKQLITCRFIAPYVSAVGLLVYDGSMLIGSIWLFVDTLSYDAVLNVSSRIEKQISQMVYPIAMFVAVVFYILNVIRYFYVRNMYLLIGNSTDGSSDSKIAIHRKVGSKLAYVILAVCLSIIIAVITISLGIPFSFANNVTRQSIMNNIVLVSNISIALFGILATVIDLIIHAKEIKSAGLGNYLFFKDPLMFRIECMVIIPAIVVGILQYIFIVAPKLDFRVRYPILSIIDIIFGLLLRLVVSGGFVSLIEIKRTICLSSENNRNSAEYQNTLEQFLSKDDQYRLMHAFCQREWSMENLMLYSELKRLKQSANGKITKDELWELYNRFIKQGSVYQVNFSGKVIPKVEAILRKPDLESELFETLYDLLYVDLMINLNDTFARLKKTTEYSVLIKQKQFSTEMMESEFSVK